jgi:UDP:flavonoid glycosyltransferase YjiC (YdhE family)
MQVFESGQRGHRVGYVAVAACGTRLPARRLSAPRLRSKVLEAMAMTDGAKRVAAGFAATGGVARGADLFEQRTLRLPAGSAD